MRTLTSFSITAAFLATFALAQEAESEQAAEPQQAAEEAAVIQEAEAAQEPSAQEEQTAAAQDATTQEPAAIAQEEPAAPAYEQPAAQEPPPVIELPKYTAKAEQPSDVEFHFGIRAGLGISAMRGHKAVTLYNVSYGEYAIKLYPAFSAGFGLVFAFEINDVFTIAPELGYTFYRASGSFMAKTGEYLRDLNFAELELHSVELPILARFSFGHAYAELGPQIGLNFRSNVNENYNLKSPDMKVLAFGPSLGGGANINGILIGIRGHLGLLEYAENTKGYPWAVHVSATKFFF